MYKDINEAMTALSVWKNNIRTSINPLSKNIIYKPTFDADYYREATLYRFIELAESAFHLYESDFLIGAIVSIRSAQETLAVTWYVSSKLQHLAKTKDIAHFKESLERLIVGWSKDEEFPKMINVMTCIDAVDKTMKGKFRELYNTLSEYAHPNYSGTFGAYGQPNHETLEVTFGKYPRSEQRLKTMFESTLIICMSLLNSIQENYEERLNDALEVCYELHKEEKFMDYWPK